MSTVIKAGERPRGAASVAFNFDDMASQANQYLDKVRAQAAQMVADAQKQADQIKQTAQQQGLKAAQQQMQQLVDAEVSGRVEPTLREVLRQLHDARHAWHAHWEHSAVRLAVQIAERICRRQLSFTPEITAALVQEALQLAAGSADVRLRLNPDDHRALAQPLNKLLADLASVSPAQVVDDPAIAPGGCRVELRSGSIDQSFAAQLARIEEELLA